MSKVIAGLVEDVKILGKKDIIIPAKFDTGAKYTSIDANLARDIIDGPHVKKVKIKSSLSLGQERPVIELRLEINGKVYQTMANIADRSHMRYKILIGRDLIYGNFLIDVSKSHKSHKENDRSL